MRNYLLIFICCFNSFLSFSQELNCSVVVNAVQTGNENQQVFKTLEKQLTEFINNTKWTNKTFSQQEAIDCNMTITIASNNGESFQATLQVQSSRPVFGSSYNTPIYNFNDKDFSFKYLEFQNLIFNKDQFESNLISVLAFHIYMILGLDADSYSKEAGLEYFKQAQAITNYSQQGNFSGWKLEDGLQSRFTLIDNILSPTFKEYRTILYEYHRAGLDIMADNVKNGKENIASSLLMFKAMNSRRPNSFLLRTFFDAKADEIEQIFSDGPNVNISSLKDVLQSAAPLHAAKWRNIKF